MVNGEGNVRVESCYDERRVVNGEGCEGRKLLREVVNSERDNVRLG